MDNENNIDDYYKYYMIDNKRALNINLNKLEITNVEYGSTSHKINVTQNMLDFIKKKQNKILVNNETFNNDPHYRKVKQLYITINNTLTLSLDENNILTYEIEYNSENLKKIDLLYQQFNKLKIDNIIKNNYENKNKLLDTVEVNLTSIPDNTDDNLELNLSKDKIEEYQNYYKNFISFEPIIGFIILRKVVDEKTDKLWIRCYDSIRKFYDNRIMIIDDNSDFKYLTVNKKLTNCSIIYSEYINRGELLSLYYYDKFNFADRVVILHDSMYINKKYDFVNIKHFNHFTRLFSFSNKWYQFDDKNIEVQFSKLDNSEELINYHNLNKGNLTGCFGCTMIIEYQFLKYIIKKYNIFSLLDHIKNRNDRKCLERTLSCILSKCQAELNFLTINDLFGTIHKHVDFQKSNNNNIFIYKEFIGR